MVTLKDILFLYYEYGAAFIEKDQWKLITDLLKKQTKSAETEPPPRVKPSALRTTIEKESELLASSSPDNCKTLADLEKLVRSFEGCALKKVAQNTVFSDGNPKAQLLLIGEAPGADEDAKGKPFVGQSGQFLDKILRAIGIDRTNCYITNIIPWRPPGNRAPSSEEIAQCLPFVKKHIDLIRPRLLILLGNIATKSILNTNDGIARLRGKILSYHLQDGTSIPVIPTFHPAYLLRSPGQKAQTWIDFVSAKRILDKV